MKITFQGSPVETGADTVAAFLEERGYGSGVVAEYKGEVLADAAALAVPLEEGAVLDAFRIVPGG